MEMIFHSLFFGWLEDGESELYLLLTQGPFQGHLIFLKGPFQGHLTNKTVEYRTILCIKSNNRFCKKPKQKIDQNQDNFDFD